MLDTDLVLGPHTTALIGVDGGRYPAGNSVLVRGDRAALGLADCQWTGVVHVYPMDKQHSGDWVVVAS